MQQKYIPIIDEGHGGLKDGVYTSGLKKMFNFTDGLIIYEGVVNRKIGEKLRTLLDRAELRYHSYRLGVQDTSLVERVKLINEAYSADPHTFLLSIHSNAASKDIHGFGSNARGNEIWTSVGQTKSDTIADIFALEYKKYFSKMRFRQDMEDGDLDKESGFYILRKTNCPAILVENGFYDNRNHAEYLLSETGQWDYATCLCKAIQSLNNENPFNRK